jgi:hypothetical protein
MREAVQIHGSHRSAASGVARDTRASVLAELLAQIAHFFGEFLVPQGLRGWRLVAFVTPWVIAAAILTYLIVT